MMWQTPLARDLLNESFGAAEPPRVETRTAEAGMAMGRIRQLHPEFEG